MDYIVVYNPDLFQTEIICAPRTKNQIQRATRAQTDRTTTITIIITTLIMIVTPLVSSDPVTARTTDRSTTVHIRKVREDLRANSRTATTSKHLQTLTALARKRVTVTRNSAAPSPRVSKVSNLRQFSAHHVIARLFRAASAHLRANCCPRTTVSVCWPNLVTPSLDCAPLTLLAKYRSLRSRIGVAAPRRHGTIRRGTAPRAHLARRGN